MLLYRRCYVAVIVAVMKNSYSEPCILFYKVRDNTLSLIIPEMILTGNDFDQMTGIMRANVQCS